MPSNFTKNYKLNQWEPGDQVKREDFNADNAKIDAAIAAKSRTAVGSYTVDAANAGAPLHIAVGFRPRAVLIWQNQVSTSNQSSCSRSAFFLDGHPVAVKDGSVVLAQVEDGGFWVRRVISGSSVYYPEIALSGTYFYIAFS